MIKPIHAVMCGLLLLAGCAGNDVKETLGLDKRAPDEFRVVSRPPLSVPPQFDLRPPGIDGVNTGQASAPDQAESLLLGSTPADTSTKPVEIKTLGKAKKETGKSTADSKFLERAGAQTANPNIKRDLTEQKINQQIEREEEGFWDKVTTIPGNKEPVVKADKEAERIKKNEEEGKPVTEGETEETGGGPVSILKRWLGDE